MISYDAGEEFAPRPAPGVRDMRLAIRRGLLGRCPNCGKGRLFRAYLKPVEACSACGEDISHIQADDGPAWLTILVVGHVLVATILMVDGWAGWPMWLSMAFYPTLGLAMCLGGLPFAKGAFIGAIWAGEGADPKLNA
jgi:uncharacterized protein (DUF983 family)